MIISVLASGSSGNAMMVGSGSTNVLLDAGLSARRVQEKLGAVGMEPGDLSGILVSHEHSDHVSGIGPVSRRFGLPVYATTATHGALDRRIDGRTERFFIETGVEFAVGDLLITAFAVSHDCVDPVGYTITDGVTRVTIATDLGVVGGSVRRHLARADCVVLEFNHDERMLIDGAYPWPLKQRIMSNVGHLSNESAGNELRLLADAPLGALVLAHMSEENNTPELAYETAAGVLDGAGRGDVAIHVAAQHEPLGPIVVGAAGRDGKTQEGAVFTCTR